MEVVFPKRVIVASVISGVLWAGIAFVVGHFLRPIIWGGGVVFEIVFQNISFLFSEYDVLWVFLAVSTA